MTEIFSFTVGFFCYPLFVIGIIAILNASDGKRRKPKRRRK